MKQLREKALADTSLNAPFTEKGLFRSKRSEQYWNAVFGKGVCAVELFTGEDAATYLYRFDEDKEIIDRLYRQFINNGYYVRFTKTRGIR